MSMPVPIVTALLVHWWGSVFFQSFFLHRYAAHGMFALSPFYQKVFHLLTYLFQGASYLNPRAYAALHMLHHTYSDRSEDPHSPHVEPNPLRMMRKTLHEYRAVLRGTHPLAGRGNDKCAHWPALEKWGKSRLSSLLWLGIYASYYYAFASSAWQYAFLAIHALMGPIHGAIVNYFGHKIGYRNFALEDQSRNTLWFDFVTLGELFQNNHHARANRPNFASRPFEFDPIWPVIVLMSWCKVLSLPTDTRPDWEGNAPASQI